MVVTQLIWVSAIIFFLHKKTAVLREHLHFYFILLLFLRSHIASLRSLSAEDTPFMVDLTVGNYYSLLYYSKGTQTNKKKCSKMLCPFVTLAWPYV